MDVSRRPEPSIAVAAIVIGLHSFDETTNCDAGKEARVKQAGSCQLVRNIFQVSTKRNGNHIITINTIDP